MATRLGIVGAVLLGLGLIAGFVPFTGGSYDCGSAFVPTSVDREAGGVTKWADAEHGLVTKVIDMPESRCDELRWFVRMPALGLVGAGVVVLVRRWYVATRSAGRARAG